VEVNVGIYTGGTEYIHQVFTDHEEHCEHGTTAVIVVADVQAIVTTHLDVHILVWHLKRVVGVGLKGVDRLGIFLYGHALVEARHIVTNEKVFRLAPVALKVRQRVGQAAVDVGHIIEGDVDALQPSQFDDGQLLPAYATIHLQRCNVVCIDDVTLRAT
jgi:hypothetical protein